MTLLARLFLLVLIAVAPALALQVHNQLQLRQERTRAVHQEARDLLAHAQADQARVLDGARELLVSTAQAGAVRDGDRARCQSFLKSLGESHPERPVVSVTDGGGLVVCSSDPQAVGRNLGRLTHVRQTLATGRFELGDFHVRPNGGVRVLPVAYPYRDRHGDPAGVVATTIGLEWLEAYLARRPLPANSTLLLADRHGTLLARVPYVQQDGWIGHPLPDRYRALLDRTGEGTAELRGLDGVARVVAYEPVATGIPGLFLAVGLDRGIVFAPIEVAAWADTGTVVLGLLLAMSAAAVGARLFFRRPVGRLVTAAERWAAGDYAARTGLGATGGEFGLLGRAFDGMAEAVAARHALERRMAAVLASTTDAVFEVDRSWTITFMNGQARALLSGGRDLVGRDLWDAFPEAVGSPFEQQYRRAVAERAAVEFEEHYAPLEAWFKVRAFPSAEGLAVYFQDVTGRKWTEQALARSEEHLRFALASAEAGTWERDLVTGRGVWSEENYRLYGLAPRGDPPTHADWLERLIHPDDRARLATEECAALAGGATEFRHEFRIAHPDRGLRWIAGQGRIDYDAAGRPVRLSGLNLDVTDRKRAEEALRASEERYRAIVETAVDAMVVIDEQGTIQSFNPAAERTFGYAAAEAVGRNVKLLMPEPDRARHDGYLENYRRTGERRIIGIGRAVEGRRRDGSTFPLELAVAEWTADGQQFFTGILRDVTARRAAEREQARLTRALEEEGRLLQAILDQMPAGLAVVEAPSGRLVLHNPAAARLLGHPLREGEGVARFARYGGQHADGTPYRPAEYPLVRAALHGETVEQEEMLYRRGDGALTTLAVSAAPVRGPAGGTALAISTFHDIGGQKALEDDLRRAKEAAERATRSKAKFLAAASHDLRQPMQSLFFFAAGLEGHVTDDRGREKLRHLERGLDTLKGLLDSLLDVSKLDAGVLRPTIEAFPIDLVLEEVRATYAPAAATKGLALEVESCPALARSDRALLGRMLRNLVENAVRYTEVGHVRIVCREEEDRLLLSVEDTGPGIPAEAREAIFEEFHQLANPERDRSRGLGLGLAIVRRLAELLDHPVALESAPGEGSVFTITVPRERLEARSVAPDPAPLPVVGRARFAVVVDDDAIVLIGLRAILEDWGYEVLVAGGTEEALAKLRACGRRPDVVVADYRLRQGRVGTEAVLRIRELCGAAIPAVLLTGETGDECRRDAAAHGLAIAHKPVTTRQLHQVLEQQMASERSDAAG